MIRSRAFKILEAENERLRNQNAELIGHLTRVDRVANGMPEAVRTERPLAQTMPPEVLAFINAWGSETTRSMLTREAWTLHGRLRDWEKVSDTLMAFAKSYDEADD